MIRHVTLFGFVLVASLAVQAAPALAGKWVFKLETPIGDRSFPVVIEQSGDSLMAKAPKNDKGELGEAKVAFAADTLTIEYPFSSEEGGMSGLMKLQAKPSAPGAMSGTWTFSEYSGPLTAKLDAMPAAPTMGGIYMITIDTPIGERKFPVSLKVDGGVVTGQAPKNASGAMADVKGTADAEGLKFEWPFTSDEANATAPMKFVLKPGEKGMVGTWSFSEYSGPATAVAQGGAQGGATAAPASPYAGKWKFVLDTPGGAREFAVELTGGAEVGGTWGKSTVAGTFAENVLKLAFKYYAEEVGATDTLKLNGTLEGPAAMSGTWAFGEFTGGFKATKQ
jgi:hypothetical protein